MEEKFIKLALNDQEGHIRINTRFISHYRPFIDNDSQALLGTIIDFSSGDSHLVCETPEELDKLLEMGFEQPRFLS